MPVMQIPSIQLELLCLGVQDFAQMEEWSAQHDIFKHDWVTYVQQTTWVGTHKGQLIVKKVPEYDFSVCASICFLKTDQKT